jgi:hypothetical protein
MPYYFQSLVKDWVILATSVLFMGWIIYLVAGLARRRQQATMQKHLLDKFASAQDFTVTSPRNSILGSIRIGFVLMFLGMGCLAGAHGGWLTVRIGWISFLVGIGFLISSAVSYFLVKKAGWKEQV